MSTCSTPEGVTDLLTALWRLSARIGHRCSTPEGVTDLLTQRRTERQPSRVPAQRPKASLICSPGASAAPWCRACAAQRPKASLICSQRRDAHRRRDGELLNARRRH